MLDDFWGAKIEFESKIYTSLLLPLGFWNKGCRKTIPRESLLENQPHHIPAKTMSDHASEAPPASTKPTPTVSPDFVRKVVGDRDDNAPVEDAGSVTDSAAEDHSGPPPDHSHKTKPSHLVSNPLGSSESSNEKQPVGTDFIPMVASLGAVLLAIAAIILSIVAIRKNPEKALRSEISEVARKNADLERDLTNLTSKHNDFVTDFSKRLESVRKLAETKPEPPAAPAPPALDINVILAHPAVIAKMNEVVSAKITEARAMIIADASAEAVYTLIGGGFKLNYGGDPVALMVDTTEDGRVNFFITPDTSAPASAEVAPEVPTSE